MGDSAYEEELVDAEEDGVAFGIRQMRYTEWNEACSSKRSEDGDMTGAKVLAAALRRGGAWLEGSRVVELGAGTGYLAVSCAHLAREWIATDGEKVTCELARENISRAHDAERVRVAPLYWALPDAEAFEREHGPVQVVVGSDLMYYRVDASELWRTARALLARASDGGVMVHAHRFRVSGQRSAFVAAAEADGYGTARVPVSAVVPREALAANVHWYGVQVLVTARGERAVEVARGLAGDRATAVAAGDDTDAESESSDSEGS